MSDVQVLPLEKRLVSVLKELEVGGGRAAAEPGENYPSSVRKFDKPSLLAAARACSSILDTIVALPQTGVGSMAILKIVVSGAGAPRLLSFACGHNDVAVAALHRGMVAIYQAALVAGHLHVAHYVLKGTSASEEVEASLALEIGRKFFVSAMLGSLPSLELLVTLFSTLRSLLSGERVDLTLATIAAVDGLTSAFIHFLSNCFASLGIDASSVQALSSKLSSLTDVLPADQGRALRSSLIPKVLAESLEQYSVGWSIFTSNPTGDPDARSAGPPPLLLVETQLQLAQDATSQLVYQRHLNGFLSAIGAPVSSGSLPEAKRARFDTSGDSPGSYSRRNPADKAEINGGGKGGGKGGNKGGGKGAGKGGGKGANGANLGAASYSPPPSEGRGGGTGDGRFLPPGSVDPYLIGSKRSSASGCKVEGDTVSWGSKQYDFAAARADFQSRFPPITNPDPVALCSEPATERSFVSKLAPGTSSSDVEAYRQWWRAWDIRKYCTAGQDFA